MTTTTTPSRRWTRDYLFDVLRELGIHHIFGVPGTNEIPLIDGTSLAENDVRYIECLHENIAMGAAMGSAVMTGKPGVLVVHVTPGIAHGIGNLFNAWRSRIPLVVIAAQQHNDLVTQEPLLASNLVEIARQFTKWAHEVRSPEEIPLVLQRAFKEAMAPPAGPVFLSVPWEFTICEIDPDAHVNGVTQVAPHFVGDRAAVEEAAAALSAAETPLIVVGDAVGQADAWAEVQELAELLGAPVSLQTFSSLANFPNDDAHWQGELPGTQAKLQSLFAAHDVALLCGFGAQAQLAVFKYSDGPLIPSNVRLIYLANNTWDIGKNYFGAPAILGDIKATLPVLNKLIRAKPPAGAAERNTALQTQAETRREAWSEYLTRAMDQPDIWAVVIADALRVAIDERDLSRRFVYVHEAISDPPPFQYLLPLGTNGGAPLSYYCVAGGSLGWSMAASLGIKLEPRGWQGVDTKLVVNVVGDGSSLFYPQAWWTAAHRDLSVLYIITNNQEYHTLQQGLAGVVGAYGTAPGYGWKPTTMDPEYLKLERPTLDFVALAKAFGIRDGEIVVAPADVAAAVNRGVDYVLAGTGSYVIDARTAKATPLPGAAGDSDQMLRYTAQPALDVFHAAGDMAHLSVIP